MVLPTAKYVHLKNALSNWGDDHKLMDTLELTDLGQDSITWSLYAPL